MVKQNENTSSTFQTPAQLLRDFTKSLNDYNYDNNSNISMAEIIRTAFVEFIKLQKSGKKWEKQVNY